MIERQPPESLSFRFWTEVSSFYRVERPMEALLVALSAEDSSIKNRESRFTRIGEDRLYSQL
jgi:hypothetical protein